MRSNPGKEKCKLGSVSPTKKQKLESIRMRTSYEKAQNINESQRESVFERYLRKLY